MIDVVNNVFFAMAPSTRLTNCDLVSHCRVAVAILHLDQQIKEMLILMKANALLFACSCRKVDSFGKAKTRVKASEFGYAEILGNASRGRQF
jgi:hypothetical protein